MAAYVKSISLLFMDEKLAKAFRVSQFFEFYDSSIYGKFVATDEQAKLKRISI
jgi:hypothetical protein